MNDRKEKARRRSYQTWLAIGAVILIILLIVWLTEADLFGATDVNAIMPVV